jgi:hypothetical protein
MGVCDLSGRKKMGVCDLGEKASSKKGGSGVWPTREGS